MAATVILVLRPQELSALAVNLLKPSIVISAIGMIALVLAERGRRLRLALHDTISIAYLGILAIAAVGIPVALWPGQAFTFVKSNILFVAIYSIVLASLPRDRSMVDRLIGVFTLAFVPLCVIELVFSARFLNPEGRLSGFGSYDPNDLAAVTSVGVILCLGTARRSTLVWRSFALLGALLGIVVVLKTGSRGGILALGAGTVVLLLGFPSRYFVGFLVALALGLPLALRFTSADVLERLATVTAVGDDYNTTTRSGRIQIWSRGIGYMIDSPLHGVGASNFSVAEGTSNERDSVRGAWLNAHNIFVQIGAELGVPGLALLIVLLATGFARASQRWKLWGSDSSVAVRPEILAALTSFAVSGFFLSHAYSMLLAFCLGLSSVGMRPKQLERVARRVGAHRANKRTRTGFRRIA